MFNIDSYKTLRFFWTKQGGYHEQTPFLSYILLIAMVSTMTYTTQKGIGAVQELVFDNYEDSDITNGYVNKISELIRLYISANSNIFRSFLIKSPFSGTKPLKIKTDMRWWSLDL